MFLALLHVGISRWTPCDNGQLAKKGIKVKVKKNKKNQGSVRNWLLWRWNHVLQQQAWRIPRFFQWRNIRGKAENIDDVKLVLL